MRAGRAPDQLTAVFLDRDGVINRKAPEGTYVESWRHFAFLPGALEGLGLLAQLGVPVVVVTNQRGVALGRMTDDEVRSIHARMRGEIEAAGARVDLVLHCPHGLNECDCRKPGVGMFEAAARAIPSIELGRSAMIGDSDADMQAAARIGALAILVADTDRSGAADLVVPDLLTAARSLTSDREDPISPSDV